MLAGWDRWVSSAKPLGGKKIFLSSGLGIDMRFDGGTGGFMFGFGWRPLQPVTGGSSPWVDGRKLAELAD